MSKSHIYRVSFYSQGTIYEVYAKQVNHDALFGFVELSEFMFNAATGLVVDPSVERLKNEFENVKKTFIPMHAILRIDEVEKEGVSKMREVTGKGNNVAHFPVPLYTPGGPPPTHD